MKAKTSSSQSRPPFVVEILLKPAAALFSFIAKRRANFYESGALPSIKVSTPVVSIGNLTAGGTGKTPITSWLVGELKNRGLTCGIVSRGYGSEVKGPALVSADGSVQSAKLFGDEPSWLASVHADVPVVIGGDRVADVKRLVETKSVQVIVADDAFQHRRLKRDLDIVVIDATEPQWHYRPLPLGRMREGFDALSRADFVFLSKVNQATAEQLNWIRGVLRDFQFGHKFKIVEFESNLAGFVRLSENQPLKMGEPNPFGERRSPRAIGDLSDPQIELSKPKGNRLVSMTAIGRPRIFRAMLEEQTGLEVAQAFEFPDHHLFTPDDLAEVESKAVALKARAIVVTEKDATKLAGWNPKVACYVSRLTSQPKSEFSTEIQDLYEAIDRLTR